MSSPAYRLGEKLAFNRSVVYRKPLGGHEFHIEYPENMSVGGVQSKFDYGYLPGKKGPDGDSLDFYVGRHPNGAIARFTKTVGQGANGVAADHKYFAGFTPEELADYQQKFPEYTHQPNAALTDRVDFKNWDHLNEHLNALPSTGPITRLQEWLGKKAPVKVAGLTDLYAQALPPGSPQRFVAHGSLVGSAIGGVHGAVEGGLDDIEGDETRLQNILEGARAGLRNGAIKGAEGGAAAWVLKKMGGVYERDYMYEPGWQPGQGAPAGSPMDRARALYGRYMPPGELRRLGQHVGIGAALAGTYGGLQGGVQGLRDVLNNDVVDGAAGHVLGSAGRGAWNGAVGGAESGALLYGARRMIGV